jgi:tRNA-specific 2-thiouridylase
VGHHQGQHNFTIGQRRGLRVASAEPLYVLAKDAARNLVRVGPREALRTDRVPVRGLRLNRSSDRVDRVKLRYRSRPLAAAVADPLPAGYHRRAEIVLDEPAYGTAPGQLACLMDGELVIGWATITADVSSGRSGADVEKLIA